MENLSCSTKDSPPRAFFGKGASFLPFIKGNLRIFSNFASGCSSLGKRMSFCPVSYPSCKDFRINLFALSIVAVSNEAR